jgi:hypothetical protein
MKSLTHRIICLTALALLIAGCSPPEPESATESQPGVSQTTHVAASASFQDFEPQYIGGYPTAETAERMFDEYDYQAAAQFYLWGYAYLNGLGFDKGMAAMGGDERSVYIWDKRIQPQHIVMTANSEVIYNCTRVIDLSNGPIVFETPPRARGHFFDIGMRAYQDTGDVGPDHSEGGKYLLVPMDYDGEIPVGYHVVRPQYSNLIMNITRTFPAAEGGVEEAVELGKQIKWYPLSEANEPQPANYVLIGDRPMSQEWPRDERAFAWLAEVFNKETNIPDAALPHLGNMRRLGFEKGKPFAPDARAQAILKRAAKTAEATALSMALQNRLKELDPIYDNRQHSKTFYNKSPRFMQEQHEEVEERVHGWHQLLGNFATYVPTRPGTGGYYLSTYKDAEGHLLMGGNTYRLRVQAEVPVKQFWQIPVYDVATRAMIENDQGRISRSGKDDMRRNDDGSVDLYFGPEAPQGYENNWIQTKPGQGWFTLPRLYAPLQPVLDKTWRWNDIELVEKGEPDPDPDAMYVGGYPTKKTAQAAFDEYDYQAAVQFYVWAYAYLNGLGLDQGLAAMGGDERSIYLLDKRVQSQHTYMTANSEVIYMLSRAIDLSKGPVVIETPPRSRGHFFDLGMRAYMDNGDVGPDKGQGGKYLVMAADYDGPVPSGYFPVRIQHSNLLIYGGRTFPAAEGGIEGAVELAKTLKWYPLAEAADPQPNGVVLIGDRVFSQEWPRDEKAFAWLAEVFDRDKVPASGLAHLGNMRRLGIQKGKPFAPDERALEILKRAAKTAEAMVLSMAFRNRQGNMTYDNRQYESIFNNRSPIFFPESETGEVSFEEVEQRAGAWHQLVGNFALYVPTKPGTGGFYTGAYRDKNGDYLIGSNTYRLRVPAEVPVKQFWQIPVYSVSTRSLMNTEQKKSTLSGTDDLRRNDDGSVDLYFGPQSPAGYEQNWIQTRTGEGWFTLPRLYAPLEAILDKSWRWNDIERIE